jgi:hypothetical protein
MPDRSAFEESCPVSDELLGELYSASKHGLPVLVATVSPDIRAMLALFCYRRTHLHTLGLAIAATCVEEDLFQVGAQAGTALFERSREMRQPATRRGITLSTGPLLTMPPIDDELSDEVDQPAGAEASAPSP